MSSKRGDDILNIVNKTLNETAIDSKESRRALMDILNTLSGREVVAMTLRNVSGMTYRQIGPIMGITHERVRQIEAKGYRKLRHPARSRVLKQFFLSA